MPAKNFYKISLITPSFNQGKYLERCILSVLEQNYPALEYIIIDGGSSDNSVEIIKKYEKHLTCWISEKDAGQSHAINKGLRHAGGEIINWLNSDDWLEKSALEKINYAFSGSGVQLLCGFSRLHQKEKMLLKRTSGDTGSFEKTLASGHIMQPSTFFRKKNFDEFTPLSERLHYMMDHYIWLQYLVKYGQKGIKFTDDIYANVQYHEEAKSVRQVENFRHDRRLIFHSLFNAAGIPFYDQPLKDSLLPFSSVAYPLSVYRHKINFHCLAELLFYRDAEGKRIKTDKAVLACMLRHYPLKTLSHFILRS